MDDNFVYNYKDMGMKKSINDRLNENPLTEGCGGCYYGF